MNNINGILVVNKSEGFTSRDVVNKVSRILGTKKIGHTGTLDPLATGVLVLTIGKCTKLSEMLTCQYKEYIAEFMLGYETDTLDITGEKTKEYSGSFPDDLEIKTVISSFAREYLQEVPLYSAVKIDGKRLYEYARNNIEVELPKRMVDIKSIDILEINDNVVKIKTCVSKGTYIRSLIRDIGEKLGTYATMSKLVRSKSGKFDIDNSYTLESIENGNYKILSPIEFLDDIQTIVLDDELFKKVDNGVKLRLDCNCDYVKFAKNDEIVAIYKREEDYYKMYVKMI